MAQHHTVVAETIVYIKKKKGYPMINTEDVDDRIFGRFSIDYLGELELVSESEDTETFKAECSVSRSITTSDEEYKVYKLLDWDDGASDYTRGIDIEFDTTEKFDIVQDDCYWVEDDEIDC